jgi:hypothetical protein
VLGRTTCGASVQLLMLAYLSLRAKSGIRVRLSVLTNECSEMAYELRDPSTRHKKKLAQIFHRAFEQTMTAMLICRQTRALVGKSWMQLNICAGKNIGKPRLDLKAFDAV